MSYNHVIGIAVIFKSDIGTYSIKFISYSNRDHFINEIWNTLNLAIEKNCSKHLKCINYLSTFILCLEIQFIIDSSFCNGIFF